MDDILVNSFLRMFTQERTTRSFFNDFPASLECYCDYCQRLTTSMNVNKCLFCEKSFCENCAVNERICKVCNLKVMSNVSVQTLSCFTVKELRILSDNYNISIAGVVEKNELIEVILINFKKSMEQKYDQVVNVTELRQKMVTLQKEEDDNKDRLLIEEMKKTKMLSNYSAGMASNEKVVATFKDSDELDITVNEVSSLSVKRMKELLNFYKIDYTHVVEKNELISLVEQLCNSFKKFKKEQNNTMPVGINSECIICMGNVINCAFIDCGHSMCCYDCGQRMNKCPICRKEISHCLKIYLS